MWVNIYETTKLILEASERFNNTNKLQINLYFYFESNEIIINFVIYKDSIEIFSKKGSFKFIDLEKNMELIIEFYIKTKKIGLMEVMK